MAKILLVDDRAVNREYLASLLSYFNHELLEAQDGADALAVIKRDQPDLIITDLLMPRMDGYQLVESIRANKKIAHIPVIFYTASYRAEEARLLGKNCGVEYVLPKPCEPQKIIDAVSQALSIKHSSIDPLIASLKHPLDHAIPIHGTGTKELIRISNEIKSYVAKSKKLHKILQPLLNGNKNLSKEKKQLEDMTGPFITNIEQLRHIGNKLYGLTEFNLELISEREPENLLALFCTSARRALECELCLIGITDNSHTIRYLYASDLNIDKKAFEKSAKTKDSLIYSLLNSKDVILLNEVSQLKFPALKSRTLRCIIGAPLLTPSQQYGFVFFINKSNEQSFDKEDVRLAKTLTSVISTLYENIDLYDLIQRHAAKLQIEVADRKTAEKDLRQSERLFRQFAENTKDVFWRFDFNKKKFIYISPSYEEIWGRSLTDIYKNPKEWFNAILPEQQTVVQEYLNHLSDHLSSGVNLEFEINHPNGEKKMIFTRMFPLKDAKGNLINILGIASDVTDLQLIKLHDTLYNGTRQILENSSTIQQAAPLLLQHICSALDFSVGDLWLIDPNTDLMKCICSWTTDEPNISQFANKHKTQLFKQGEGFPAKIWKSKKIICLDDVCNSYFTEIESDFAPLQGVFGLPIFHKEEILGAIEFLTKRKQKINSKIMDSLTVIGSLIGAFIKETYNEEQLHSLINFDMLTGVATRITFEKFIKNHILKNEKRPFSLVILDLVNFNIINENMGHATGDAILQQVAERLLSLVTTPEAVARVAADKFVLFFDNLHSPAEVDKLIEKIFERFNDPFYYSGNAKQIGLRLGISFYPQDGKDISTLIRNADIALMRAKQQELKFAYFSAEMSATMHEKLEIEKDLYLALKNEKLQLYYQPIVSLEEDNIHYTEALIRWEHPQKGFISPEKFIRIAEESNLIILISKWVLTKACENLKELLTRYPEHEIEVSINLSAKQFKDPLFLKMIKETIDSYQLDCHHFTFEITESILINNLEKSKEIFAAIKKWGAKIALDDFGTVYSSLSYLKHFPIDYLKIDKSFIQKIPQDEKDNALAKAIIALGKSLDMQIIAEGVETKAQFEFLKEAGCHKIQGFYCYKPMPYSDYLKLLATANK